ncbi:hypothetical protein E1200_07250 [Actinomadura sp. GC306]|uniref:YhaN family protein n=1 Tax=Actinomadura sp. GC306 TaxID=2530367 RepID=UPI0010506197|nr:YhaN family protein [Actinomadura sp. GC306]TDC69807.1 hypothetical protein E1200_07250 [Actinomadura sp. GC306]
MRIERLDLIAYGAFDGHSLHDLGAPGVHLVHGPNEAGKSTALSALDQLLYGIDHNSRYAFRHGSRMQLGARLSTADGVALEIVRRKRRKGALVDGDGDPLGEEALVPFLGGVDRNTFTTEFALNSDELRRGGELLASGGGDMAQLLAAARSGMRLNAVLDKIEARQRELWLRTGKKPAINASMDRLKDVRQRFREAVLRPEQYRDAEQAADEAERRLSETKAELRAARRRQAAKHRLQENLPALAQCRDLERQIKEISAQGPVAPDDIRAALPELLQLRSEHITMRSVNAVHLERTERQLSETDQDDSLLPHAAAIEKLARDITAILDELDRQNAAVDELSGKRVQAESRLRTVHPRATLVDEGLYRLPDTLRGEGQTLRDQGRTLRENLNHERDAVQRCRDKHERFDKELSALPAGEDVSQLQDAYMSIPAGLSEKLADTEAEEKKLDRRFRQARNRLELPELPPEGVLELRPPDPEQVTAAVRASQNLAERLRDRRGELDGAQRQLAKCRRALQRLVTDDAPPTHDELRARRAERDDLIGSSPDDPSGMEALREAVRRADDTADLMLRHAETVNKRAELSREITDLETVVVPGHQAAVDDVAAEQELEQRHWESLWERYPAPVPGIEQGSKVLDDFGRLQADARDLQDLGIELEGQRDRLNAHTARLQYLLRLDAETPAVDGTAQASAMFAEMKETARKRLQEHERTTQDRAALERQMASAEAELIEAESAKEEAEKALADHDGHWQRFLTSAGLAADRDFDAALTDLETLLHVAAEVDDAEAAERKLRQGEQRISEFEDRLKDTFNACCRDVPASVTGWQQAIETLEQDLQKQREGAQRRKDLLEQKADFAERVDKAKAELSGLESRLQDFSARLGLASIAELEAAAQRAVDLREKSTALANIRQTLPEGQELVVLREQAGETSADELAEELAGLDEEIKELEAASADWLEKRLARRQLLDGLDGGGDAARAEADIAQLCAELAENAEEYLRLEAAKVAIHACMEEYRTNDQEPVLALASDMFAKLTRGSYTGLEMSDEERPSIRAKSSTGTLAPTALSEGARDQLYLALRLATLERHAAAGNALPIAVDDIFMTFDERRTEAALHVLDGMADRFQVIVFTHHEHVIRSAAKELPKDRCHVHHLPARPE